jgi:hypothetical protein
MAGRWQGVWKVLARNMEGTYREFELLRELFCIKIWLYAKKAVILRPFLNKYSHED